VAHVRANGHALSHESETGPDLESSDVAVSTELLQAVVVKVIEELVLGDYDSLIEKYPKSRVTSAGLRAAIRDYGGQLVRPPPNAYQNLDAVRVSRAKAPTWSVRAPLWTEEEGRSDLTLELTVTLGPGTSSVEIDDLRVS
jgi:hypothetical protein